jgi:predicted metal-dependent hydrolase
MAASRRPDPAQLPLFVATEPTASTRMRQSPSAPAAPASPTPSVAPTELTPAAFRHPQAAREIVLSGHTVGYALKRVRRRSIGFIVGTEGLCVNVPSWVGARDIETALREKANWILGKLHQQQERGRRLQSARVDWRDGVTIPFLGQTVVVVLDARAGITPSGAVLDAGAGDGTPCRLHTGLPSSATPEQIRDAVQSWLQRQARRVFAERCEHYATQLGVRYRRLSLSSAQTRWGSASADGSIRLSWRLIHFGVSTIDYVVAHELAHLREMNHSPRFWDVVRSVVPDYQRTREVLKTDVLPIFD